MELRTSCLRSDILGSSDFHIVYPTAMPNPSDQNITRYGHKVLHRASIVMLCISDQGAPGFVPGSALGILPSSKLFHGISGLGV